MGAKQSAPTEIDKFDFLQEQQGKRALLTFSFGCDVCHKPIADKRFCCLTCSEQILDTTFDVCAQCADKHVRKHSAEGPHRLCVGPAQPELAVYPSFAHTLANRVQCHAFKKFIGTRRDGPNGISWEYTTYYEVYSKARALSTFINKLIGERKTGASVFIAITGANRADWVVADFAAAFSGAVSVPLHTTNGSAQLEAMLTHSTASICICDGPQLAKLRAINCPALRHIICMDVVSAAEQEGAGGASKPTLHAWATALEGAENPATWDKIRAAKDESELRTLMYTSGSTGVPKAAMIADRSAIKELAALSPTTFAMFAFQPQAYSTQRLVCLEALANGGRMCYWDGDMSTFFDQLRATGVSYFSAPPRIWNILYSTYKAKLAIAEGREGLSTEEAKNKVFKYIKDIFGRNCNYCSTGGAITAPVVLEWMHNVIGGTGITVSEGYGITEAGTIAVNGVRVFECAVHLEDVPELNYFGTDKPARGMLWVHTRDMAMGYHHDPGNTADNFKDIYNDGRIWFNTGDIVEYNKRLEQLRVIDRKKNIVKLANSCFVAPEHLENVFIASPLVVNIWVHASSAEECIVVVVHPNRELLQQQSELNNVHFESYEEMCSSAEAKRWVLQSLTDVGRAQGLQPYETPRGVILEPVAWTPATGEMTMSFKLSRIGLLHKYRAALDALYATLSDRQPATASVTAPKTELAAPAPIDSALSPTPTVGTPSEEEAGPSMSAVFTQIVSEVAKVPAAQIDMSRPLSDCGIDSSAILHLTALLKANNLTVPSIEALVTTPFSRLMEVVCGSAAETPYRIDWDHETSLPTDVVESIKARAGAVPKVKRCVLLTGATGFLGAFILRDLLVEGCRVICLVRAADADAAMAHLKESATLFSTHDVLSAHESQVVPLAGDFSKDNFGLAAGVFDQLSRDIDGIIHNGANVSGVLPYPALRAANVTSTLTCLRLAVLSGARLIYVSSISSLDTLERGCEPVAFPSPYPLRSMNGYGASKRVSEILLCKAFLQGFTNCAIVRPGSIGPCPVAGCLSPNDTITRYLRSIVQLASTPSIAHTISLCAVSDLSLFTVKLLAAQPPSDTGVRCPSFNVTGPSIIAIKDITVVARELGWAVTDVPFRAFVERVMSETDPNRCDLVPIKSYFSHGSFPMDVEDRVNGDSTANFFSDHSLPRTIVDKGVIRKTYQWFMRCGMLPPPASEGSAIEIDGACHAAYAQLHRQ